MADYPFLVSRSSSDDLATYLDHLHPFGVRMQKALNTTVSCHMSDGRLVASIGELTVWPATGIIAISPYNDATTADKLMLAQCAEEAFENKPRRATKWYLARSGSRRRWYCTINVFVGASYSAAAAFIANRTLRLVHATDLAAKARIEVAP